MAPRRKISALGVQFTNTSIPTCTQEPAITMPFFLTSNGISGVVNTTSLSTTFDSLIVELEGSISVRIPQRQCSYKAQYGINAAPSHRRLNNRTIRWAQTLEVGPVTGRTLFPFHIDMVRQIRNHGQSGKSSSLPPTLFFKKMESSPTSTQGELTEIASSYKLSVIAVMNNTVVEIISVPVRIYDNSHVQPPAYQAPKIPEYANHQSSSFRRNLITKTGIFSATIPAEPAPMVFSSENDFATTTLPLQLAAETKSALSALDASIVWRLRSSTVASLMPMHTCPTVRQARSVPLSMISAHSLGRKHEIKMQFGDFEKINDAYSWYQDIAIALPKTALLIPTTHTEHISRHYSVQVEICVRGKDAGRANACVEIPLQIGYQDTSELEAPRYREREERAYVSKPDEQISRVGGRSVSPPPEYTR